MNFVQTEFLWLMATVYLAYWVGSQLFAGRARLWQNVVLLVASVVFYGWIHPWWLILLFGSAVLDFTMGQLMVRAPARKKLWLILSLSGNIGMLMYFIRPDAPPLSATKVGFWTCQPQASPPAMSPLASRNVPPPKRASHGRA